MLRIAHRVCFFSGGRAHIWLVFRIRIKCARAQAPVCNACTHAHTRREWECKIVRELCLDTNERVRGFGDVPNTS